MGELGKKRKKEMGEEGIGEKGVRKGGIGT